MEARGGSGSGRLPAAAGPPATSPAPDPPRAPRCRSAPPRLPAAAPRADLAAAAAVPRAHLAAAAATAQRCDLAAAAASTAAAAGGVRGRRWRKGTRDGSEGDGGRRKRCRCLPPSLLRDTLSSRVCRYGSTALELDGVRNTKI